MAVLDDLKNEVEQLPPELQQQVLEHARALRQGLVKDGEENRETPEQVEAQAILGHS